METAIQIPTVVITDASTGESLIFHLWEDASLETSHEVSDKPTLAGHTGDIVRRLPSVMKLSLVCSDDLVVPTIGGPRGVYQSQIGKDAQLERVRALDGKVVAVTTRIGSLAKGILRSTRSSDVVQFDNTAKIDVEVREIIEADAPRYGHIVVIPNGASDTAAVTRPVEQDGTDAHVEPEQVNALEGAGNVVNRSRGAGIGFGIGVAVGAVLGGPAAPLTAAGGGLIGAALGSLIGGRFG